MMETRTPLDLYSSAVLASENIRKELDRMTDDIWEEMYAEWKKRPRWVRWLFSIDPPTRANVILAETDYCWAYHELQMQLEALEKLQDYAANSAGVGEIEVSHKDLGLIRIWTKLNRS